MDNGYFLDPVLVYGAQLALVGANYGLIKLIGKDGLDLRYVCRRVIPPASAVILFAAITGGLLTGWLATDPLRGMGVALAIAAEGLFILALSALRGATATWRYALAVYAKSALLLAGTAFVFLVLHRRGTTRPLWCGCTPSHPYSEL